MSTLGAILIVVGGLGITWLLASTIYALGLDRGARLAGSRNHRIQIPVLPGVIGTLLLVVGLVIR